MPQAQELSRQDQLLVDQAIRHRWVTMADGAPQVDPKTPPKVAKALESLAHRMASKPIPESKTANPIPPQLPKIIVQIPGFVEKMVRQQMVSAWLQAGGPQSDLGLPREGTLQTVYLRDNVWI